MTDKRPDKFIFLDRDGVINVERGDYTRNREEWQWADCVFESIRKLNDAGFGIIVLTNQSAISRGIMTEVQLAELHNYMLTEIEKHGGKILSLYYCPHKLADGCNCRKPEPGMLLQAAKDYGIDLSKTYFIGDSPRDMEAATRAGAKGILIENEYTHRVKEIESYTYVFKVGSLMEAVEKVVGNAR